MSIHPGRNFEPSSWAKKGDKTYYVNTHKMRKGNNQALMKKSISLTREITGTKHRQIEWWYDLDMMERCIFDIMEKGINAYGNKIHCIAYAIEDEDKLLRKFDEIQQGLRPDEITFKEKGLAGEYEELQSIHLHSMIIDSYRFQQEDDDEE